MPGVGNFSAVSETLRKFRDGILETVESGVPLLGICLGMQLLFVESEEGGRGGLSIFDGKVVKFPNYVKVPHIGWNTLTITKQNELVENVKEGSFVYFAHSYYSIPTNKDLVIAETTYGVKFASIVGERNIYGTQFHPEKSGKTGATILKNFARIIKR